MSSVDLSRLTAIVHTCDQPGSVDRLVRSVRRFYPQMRVLVADVSRRPAEVAGADMVRLPADVGVSAARNAALARVRTPYFLLLEGGHEFSRATRIEQLLDLVAHSRCDVAAGNAEHCERRLFLFTRRTPDPGHATFEFADGGLTLRPGHRPGIDGWLPCDLAHNFFVARTDRVRALGGWDPQLLVDERIEFFVRAQRFGLRVGVCPDVVVSRWSDPSAAATQRGARDFTALALAKMGIARLTDLGGRVHEAAPTSRAA